MRGILETFLQRLFLFQQGTLGWHDCKQLLSCPSFSSPFSYSLVVRNNVLVMILAQNVVVRRFCWTREVGCGRRPDGIDIFVSHRVSIPRHRLEHTVLYFQHNTIFFRWGPRQLLTNYPLSDPVISWQHSVVKIDYKRISIATVEPVATMIKTLPTIFHNLACLHGYFEKVPLTNSIQQLSSVIGVQCQYKARYHSIPVNVLFWLAIVLVPPNIWPRHGQIG